MTQNTQTSSGRRKRRFSRRFGLALLALAALFAVGIPFVYRYVTDEERIRLAAQAYLQRLTTGEVHVEGASVSWSEGIRLHGVSLFAIKTDAGEAFASTRDRTMSATVISDDDPRTTFCTCAEVTISPDFKRLLSGTLSLESITAVRPRCTIVREDGRTTHLTGLLRTPGSKELSEWSAGLPRVELREANVRVLDRSGGRERVVDDITMDVRGRASDGDPLLYDVVWQRESSSTARGHSQIDLPAGRFRNVDGGLPWMSLEAVMIAVNAQLGESGSWHELLGIEGNVRASDYQFGTASGDTRSATIELVDASLSIPADDHENALPPDQRYLRFDHVRGELTVSGNEASARFHGLFHGSQCDVVAKFIGVKGKLKSLDDVDVDLAVTLREAELPTVDARLSEAQARFLDRWPPVGNFICDYDPHGIVDLDVHATKRAGANEPFEIQHLLLTAHGGDASLRWFPYRVYGITGTVELNPQGVFVPSLRGSRHGGEIELSAWLSDCNRCADGIMLIKARNLPVDDELLAALPDRFERICRNFSLAGEFTADLSLTRELCEHPSAPKPWRGETRLELNHASASYVHLPYPIRDVSGTLSIERDVVHLHDVRGRVGEGSIVLSGRAPTSNDSGGSLDLSIQAAGVAVDEQLFAVLPDNVRERLAAVEMEGSLNLDARVRRDPESGRPTYSAGLTIAGSSLRLPGMPVTFTDVAGHLTVTPLTMTVDGITAALGDAKLDVRGRWAYGLPDSPVGLDMVATDLKPTDEAIAALPSRFRESLGGWRSEGPLDVTLRLERDRGQPAVRLASATLSFRDATVSHPRLPIPLEEVNGSFIFVPGTLTADDITARWGPASLRAGMKARSVASGVEGTLELHAADLDLGPALLAALPDAFRERWARSGPGGTADVHLDHVRFHRGAAETAWSGEFEARADLAGVSLGAGGVEDACGEIELLGTFGADVGAPSLTGTLRLDHAKLFGQPVENLLSGLSLGPSDGGRLRLVLDGVEGSLHDGRLSGQGFVDLADPGAAFGTSITLREVEIGPMMKSQPREGVRVSRQPPVRGRLSSRMHVSGRFGDPQSLRGGGSVEIHEGHFYRLPIILAILQVINLSPPQDDVFDRASADFYVVGSRMQLANVELRSKVLMLTGAGELSLPDQGLDLNLVHTNPNRWTRLPMVADLMEGASREFVELHVTGPLSRPTVRARALPRLVDELGELFRRREPPITRSAGS